MGESPNPFTEIILKQCPKCNKKYDDTWGICLCDSTELTQLEKDPPKDPVVKLS